MTFIREWAVTVCGAAILCTLLSRLFPDSTVGQQGRMLLPCVFLLALLLPLSRGKITMELPAVEGDDTPTVHMEARLQQQAVEQVNGGLLAMCNEVLTPRGYQAKKVVTDMDILDEGRIDMTQITVYVDEDTARHRGEVVPIIEKRLGTAVHLAVWEETP